MRKVSKKIISCFMLCALMMSSIMGFAITSNAASENSGEVYYVNTRSSLESAVDKAHDGDCIEFTDDIVCDGNLRVSKRITIDLRYHSLTFKGMWAERGLITKNGPTLKNGVIYGADNSRSAIAVYGGELRLQNMDVFGGNRQSDYTGSFAHCYGIYAEFTLPVPAYTKVYLNNCYIKGGNSYKNDNLPGKAIFDEYNGLGIISEGKGYIAVDGTADVDSGKSQREDYTNVYYVGDESSLRKTINCVQDGDSIEFTDDIVYYGNIDVNKNITIDFNNHSLKFRYASRGLYITASEEVTLKNGAIYGDEDSYSAVYLEHGCSNLNLQCMGMKIYGGNCKYISQNYGNGIYSWSYFYKIRMNGCYVKGGDGYRKQYCDDDRTGKAIYGGKVISEGKGYIAVDGIYK